MGMVCLVAVLASFDGAFVGAEVARDDLRVGADRFGVALGDDGAGFHAVDPVGDAHDQRHVVLDHDHGRVEVLLDALDQRAERLGFTLGDTGGRLVEAEHRLVDCDESGEFDDATGPGREVGDEVVGVAPEPEIADDLVGDARVVGGRT